MKMARIYSKSGCVTCRRRKKKCGEEKPVCLTCSRLNLFCVYKTDNRTLEKRPRATSHPGADTSHHSIRSIGTTTFRSDTEASILRSAPASAVAFFSPVCSAEVLDLRVLWQLSLQDDLLRYATLAAFSRIRGTSGELGRLDRPAYGLALNLVREAIRSRELTRTERICLQPAILWLGWVESVGIGALNSIRHWSALCTLASQAKRSGFWREIPPRIYVLILEASVIHFSLHSMFVDELQSAWKVWQKCRLIEILDVVNPPGPQRMANSPILSGQYSIYAIMLEVIVLLRHQEEHSTSRKGRIDEMERFVRRKINTINQDFLASLAWGCSLEHIAAASQAFQLACNSALLCLIVLADPMDDRVQEFDALASKTLDMFLGMSLVSMTHGTTSWAVAILACATRSQSDFDRLSNYWMAIRKRADREHFVHMDLLFDRLCRLRAAEVGESGLAHNRLKAVSKRLPIGLTLLCQEYGVLSDDATESQPSSESEPDGWL